MTPSGAATTAVLLILACVVIVSTRCREEYTVSGQMTHYAGSEANLGYGTGTVGYMGTGLKKNKSVAVKESQWASMGCRALKMNGKTYIVDNVCRGPGCKDLDLYVGDNVSSSRLSKLGTKKVTYEVLGRDSKCMKQCKWNCPPAR